MLDRPPRDSVPLMIVVSRGAKGIDNILPTRSPIVYSKRVILRSECVGLCISIPRSISSNNTILPMQRKQVTRGELAYSKADLEFTSKA